jgi:hypothetical protein
MPVPFHPGILANSAHNKWVAERRGIYRHIEQYGNIVRRVAQRFKITLWSSAHDLALKHPEMYTDRIHANRQLNFQVGGF